MNVSIPRFMIAGSSSGCGKTSITLGLITLLKEEGFDVSPFKVGPDYIDPGHLKSAAGKACRNLDPILMSPEGMVRRFIEKSLPEAGAVAGAAGAAGAAEAAGASDSTGKNSSPAISVVEGVMGLYDGRGGTSPEGSSADVARQLSIPVLVVLDAGASAQTAGAVALGMKLYDPDTPVAGFIANRVGSERHFRMVKKAVEEATGLPLLGWIPKSKELMLPERHLGLVAAWEEEDPGDPRSVVSVGQRFAALLREKLDIKALLKIAEAAPRLSAPAGRAGTPSTGTTAVRLGVAMDKAFHFYYQDNLDILESLGAELVPFSPISETKLPKELDGLYFGGGYPELHARQLSENTGMLSSIREASLSGMPIYGECGGLMYLARRLDTDEGSFPMAGIFDAEIEMGGKLSALGYHDAITRQNSILGPAGSKMTGHIYRWSRFRKLPEDPLWLFELEKGDKQSFDGFSVRRSVGAYLHIHFAGSPDGAVHFIQSCAEYRSGRSISCYEDDA
jgi:cobyrinic acid a,c-diamide synthase